MKLDRLAALMAAVAAIGTLATGCGGGSSSAPAPAPAPAPSVSVTTSVIDGAIQNATVCLDKNENSACDSDEPSGKTAADGSVTLTVLAGDAGKYPLLALVGTDAADADSGPVATAYAMKAPADNVAVISPLTTMVQHLVESSKVSSADAAKIIQDQTGITVSLFNDYTQTRVSSAASAAAGLFARTFIATLQRQTQALAGALGTADSSGGTISQADLDKAVRDALMAVLPKVVAASADSGVQSACSGAGVNSAACNTALQGQALALLSQTGLSGTTLAVLVGLNKQLAGASADPNATPTEGASLDFARFGDASNWSYRIFVSTAEENTPDANGLIRYRDIHRQMVGGALTEWGFNSDPNRKDDAHWNGTAWVNCPFGFQNTQTVRDAQGRNTSNYCDGFQKSNGQRADVDISGQPMSGVLATLRSFPSSANPYPLWGTPPAGFVGTSTFDVGTSTFPAGSKLRYQTTTPTEFAYAYDVRASNVQLRWSAGISAGGDARGIPSHPCNSTEAGTGSTINPGTLDNLIAAFPGTPCLRTPGSITSGSTTFPEPPDPVTGASIAWQYTSVNLGTLGTVSISSTPTAYFTGNTPIRVAFTGSSANAVTYYGCQQVFILGGIRQCATIGTGTYTITTLGDARVMSFNNPPALAAGLASNRVFIERGGNVYVGYQNKLSPSKLIRLNLTAANAIFAKAGVPAVSTAPPCKPCAFTPVGATMTTTRSSHTATLLASGQVLLTGGVLDSSFVALDSAELYDPATNRFTAIGARMTSLRNQHTATGLPNGKVLIAGGSNNGDGDGLDTAELYDPATQTFTALPARMKAPRGGHTATLLANGQVLLTGGFFNGSAVSPNTAELFNPATQTFTAVTATMTSKRASHAASLLPNGKVLLIGGNDRTVVPGGPSTNVILNTTELYDPATQTFTALTAVMTAVRAAHSATSLPGGQILVAGGTAAFSASNLTAFNTTEVYDPVANTFTALSATLTTARSGHTATVLGNGAVLFAGGANGSNNTLTVLNTAETYGP